MKINYQNNIIKEVFILIILLSLSVGVLIFFPQKINLVTSTAEKYLWEMILILPAVMIIMGLFAKFIPNRLVEDYLGKFSGFKGMLIALFLGMLPTGPLYVAFPLAALWLKKGASISNIVVFLSAWACIKIPQEIVEFQFLGFKFMLVRLVLTVIFVMIMGKAIEKIIQVAA